MPQKAQFFSPDVNFFVVSLALVVLDGGQLLLRRPPDVGPLDVAKSLTKLNYGQLKFF